MPHRTVNFVKGQIYHFYNRGVARQPIFIEDENYQFFIRRLRQYERQLQLHLIAFALLPNHFHLCVKQEANTPAGKLPQLVCNSYSKAFNKRYQRSGPLFQGRYGARMIEDNEDLLNVCAYIHANPVTARLADQPEDWPFSDLSSWLEKPSNPENQMIIPLYLTALEYRSYLQEVIERKKPIQIPGI